MRTVAANLQAAGQAAIRAPYAKIYVDDQRIRSWIHLDGSTPNKVKPFDTRLTNNSKILRVRNNDGTLVGHLATISDSATFSAVTLAATAALSYGGVSLFNDTSDSSPNRMDLFYIENSIGVGTTTRIKRQTSSDNGTTWATSSNVTTISGGAQRSQSRLQLSVVGWDGNGGTYSPVLFYTSFSTSKNPYYGPNIHFYDGPGYVGAADTNYRCTLDSIGGLSVLSQSEFVPRICGVQINETDYACIFQTKSPRDQTTSGIYIIFFRSGIWSNVYPIVTFNNWKSGLESDYKVSTPTLEYINGVYWLFYTQSTIIGGLSSTTTQRKASHLMVVRSKDLIHWSDALVIAGDDFSYDSGDFEREDWENGSILHSGTRLFLVGYNQLFRTSATSLISTTESDYSSKQIELTCDTLKLSIDEPEGGAAQASIQLTNSDRAYNGSTILRRGSRVIVKAGYHTDTNTDANDLETVFQGRIDTVRFTSDAESGKNDIAISARNDADKALIDYVSPAYHEFSSGRQFRAPWIRDYGALIQVQGQWLIAPHSSFITAQAPSRTSKPPIDILTINTNQVEDCIFDMKFAIRNSYTNCSIGPILRYNGNDDFLWLAFNNAGDQKWDLLQCSNSTQLRTLLGATNRVAPNGTVPQLNKDWWVRVALYQNKLIAYARREGVKNWTRILTYQTAGKIDTGRGFVGIGAVSSSISTKNDSNSGKPTGYYNTDNVASQEMIAQKFEVPTFAGSRNSILVSFSTVFQITGQPEGQINIKVLSDEGSGQKPANATQAGNVVASKTLQMSDLNSVGWTSGAFDVQVSLPQGGKYWLMIQPIVNNADGLNDVAIAYNNTGGDTDACTSTDNGATWTSQGGIRLLYAMGYTIKGGAATVGAFQLYTGEQPQTLDSLVRHIAAKSGVLDYQPNYWIDDDFTDLSNFDTTNKKGNWSVSGNELIGYNSSAYGFIRCNLDTIHDGLYEFDMTLNNSSGKGLFCFAQQNTSALTTDSNIKAYMVEFDPASNYVNMYACNTGLPSNSNMINQGTPLVDLQTGFTYHVKIQNTAGFIMVYINDVLVSGGFDQTRDLHPAGYLMFGCYGGTVGTPAVKFSNFKIPEMYSVKDYFVLEAGKSAQSSIEDLLNLKRAYFYGASDSKTLIYGTFNRLSSTSQATFQQRLVSGNKTDDDTKWVSHVRPTGDYHADRYSGTLLDSDGLRFQSMNYTETRTDAQAYRQGAFPLRQSRERLESYVFVSANYPGLERNDRITIINAWDGTNGDYVVDSISKEIDIARGVYDSQVMCRLFVAVDAESGS